MEFHAPATARNREPIRQVLSRALPPVGLVLELAAGSGEHAVYFAASFPHLAWQPSDSDAAALASIAAHRDSAETANLRAPILLDAAAPEWQIDRADAILCINMIHIAPWRAAEGLMAGAARILTPGGLLYLYGPYRENGAHTADSNRVFDESLRARNPAWGVRDLESVIELAADQGLSHEETVVMPANNRSVIFRQPG